MSARAGMLPMSGRPLLHVACAVLTAAAAAAGCGRGAAEAARADEAPARVVAVHPGGGAVPANLLRAYVVFSQPMRLGESGDQLTLVDETGRRIEGAFLRLEEELWDPTRRRLTVLFDPGRIKRGLRTNLEQGAPLVEGGRYRLLIDRAWRDGRGRPLAEGHAVDLEVGAADRDAPDPARWQLSPMVPGTREPLVIRFPEPLDRALLSHALSIVDTGGRTVEGEIEVGNGDREWRFTPAARWAAGAHALRVSTALEDVAGNSLRRVFDTDLTAPPTTTTESDYVTLAIPEAARGLTE